MWFYSGVCYDLRVFSPASYFEILTFKVMLSGCGALMRYLCYHVKSLGTELQAGRKRKSQITLLMPF